MSSSTLTQSRYADESAARQAVEMVLPMIERAMRDPAVGDSGFLYIVIMDPGSDNSCADFESAVLYEYAVGDRAQWDADYSAYARAKAAICWRTGRDGHAVRAISPHPLRREDTDVWGGTCTDGIVVGVSGANPWFDEAFASCVANCLRAIAKGRAAG